jgi:hypothetical protein
MSEISQNILYKIRNNPLPGLKLDPELLSPQYQGYSILNIPASAAGLLDTPGLSSAPLAPEIINPIQGQGEIKNIILILLDALGYDRFLNWLTEDPDLIWNQLQKDGMLAPLTSICPSTTCAAITSFWTDSAPTRHGIMGYEMWLKEYGITANMIEHKPITYRATGGNLSLAGFDPETFLPVGSITDHYQQSGVEVHAFQHFAIINSGLSRMFMRDANRHTISTAPDMWISIRELLESRPDARKYIWAYWDRLDSISHFHGPDSERARAELMTFSRIFEDYFLNELDPVLKKDTMVILTADHGQITTDRDKKSYQLINHPQFLDMLQIMPTGENRLAYLHIKPGKVEAIKEYIQKTWPDQFELIDPGQAVNGGLFGPGEPHPEIYNRIGDLIVAAKGNAYWWWAAKENPLIGRHGGLSAEEMLVPFLAARL